MGRLFPQNPVGRPKLPVRRRRQRGVAGTGPHKTLKGRCNGRWRNPHSRGLPRAWLRRHAAAVVCWLGCPFPVGSGVAPRATVITRKLCGQTTGGPWDEALQRGGGWCTVPVLVHCGVFWNGQHRDFQFNVVRVNVIRVKQRLRTGFPGDVSVRGWRAGRAGVQRGRHRVPGVHGLRRGKQPNGRVSLVLIKPRWESKFVSRSGHQQHLLFRRPRCGQSGVGQLAGPSLSQQPARSQPGHRG